MLARVSVTLPGSLARAKPSKAPLYAEAFKRFCRGERDIPALAESLGLRADNVVALSHRAKWWDRLRELEAGQAIAESNAREVAVLKTDLGLVTIAADHVERFGEGWREVASKVLCLPLEPGAAEAALLEPAALAKERVRLISRKADLMRVVSQGLRDMTLVAAEIGLVKAGPRAEAETSGKLDMSKLTQLNITINAALAAVEERPAEVVELPALPEAAPTAEMDCD